MEPQSIELPYFHVCPGSVIDLGYHPSRSSKALGGRVLAAGQLFEFARMTKISWLELCHVLQIDALLLPEYKLNLYLDRPLRERFLDILIIYGKGYAASGDIQLFNRWMRTERAYLGYISPLALLTSTTGRRMVRQWIRQERWKIDLDGAPVSFAGEVQLAP